MNNKSKIPKIYKTKNKTREKKAMNSKKTQIMKVNEKPKKNK